MYHTSYNIDLIFILNHILHSDGDRLSDMEADGADTGLVIDMK